MSTGSFQKGYQQTIQLKIIMYKEDLALKNDLGLIFKTSNLILAKANEHRLFVYKWESLFRFSLVVFYGIK